MADLGTPGLSWRRLSVLITQLPRDSALYRSVHGEAADWGIAEYLLALLADIGNLSIWQQGGCKGAKPKPVPRPGVTDKTVKKIGGDVVRSPERIAEILASVATPEEVTDGS